MLNFIRICNQKVFGCRSLFVTNMRCTAARRRLPEAACQTPPQSSQSATSYIIRMSLTTLTAFGALSTAVNSIETVHHRQSNSSHQSAFLTEVFFQFSHDECA